MYFGVDSSPCGFIVTRIQDHRGYKSALKHHPLSFYNVLTDPNERYHYSQSPLVTTHTNHTAVHHSGWGGVVSFRRLDLLACCFPQDVFMCIFIFELMLIVYNAVHGLCVSETLWNAPGLPMATLIVPRTARPWLIGSNPLLDLLLNYRTSCNSNQTPF